VDEQQQECNSTTAGNVNIEAYQFPQISI
jgi:hypothetical protein